jgi:hypothetical protein
MRNGIARSNVSPRECAESLRRAVSVSSARQPFVRICEGKNWLTMQKILTHQTLYRLDNELQHQPPKDHKNGA